MESKVWLGVLALSFVVLVGSLAYGARPVSAYACGPGFSHMSQFYSCEGRIDFYDNTAPSTVISQQKALIWETFRDEVFSSKWGRWYIPAQLWCKENKSGDKQDRCEKYVSRYTDRMLNWTYRVGVGQSEPDSVNGAVFTVIEEVSSPYLPDLGGNEIVLVFSDSGDTPIPNVGAGTQEPPNPEDFVPFESMMSDTWVDEDGNRWECHGAWYYQGGDYPTMFWLEACAKNRTDDHGLDVNNAEQFQDQLYNNIEFRDFLWQEFEETIEHTFPLYRVFRSFFWLN